MKFVWLWRGGLAAGGRLKISFNEGSCLLFDLRRLEEDGASLPSDPASRNKDGEFLSWASIQCLPSPSLFTCELTCACCWHRFNESKVPDNGAKQRGECPHQ